jgi:hypothetical protein
LKLQVSPWMRIPSKSWKDSIIFPDSILYHRIADPVPVLNSQKKQSYKYTELRLKWSKGERESCELKRKKKNTKKITARRRLGIVLCLVSTCSVSAALPWLLLCLCLRTNRKLTCFNYKKAEGVVACGPGFLFLESFFYIKIKKKNVNFLRWKVFEK